MAVTQSAGLEVETGSRFGSSGDNVSPESFFKGSVAETEDRRERAEQMATRRDMIDVAPCHRPYWRQRF